MSWMRGIENPGVGGWIEIAILAVALYYLLKFFRGTRAASILTGLAVLFVCLILVTKFTNLLIINWLLQRVMIYLMLALVVIFQPEVRRALARIGQRTNFLGGRNRTALTDPIVVAVRMMAERKIGALIAIERDVETRGIQDTGVALNCDVSAELLATIFYPGTPLHDGGVIINADKIAAAGCVFPLTQSDNIARNLGTRHRAAIGMTEESDAIVIAVSEETGVVSIAYNGRLKRGFDDAHLKRILSAFLSRDSHGIRPLKKRTTANDSGQLNFIFGEAPHND